MADNNINAPALDNISQTEKNIFEPSFQSDKTETSNNNNLNFFKDLTPSSDYLSK